MVSAGDSMTLWIRLSSLPGAGAAGVVCQAIDFDLVETAQSIFAHLLGLEK